MALSAKSNKSPVLVEELSVGGGDYAWDAATSTPCVVRHLLAAGQSCSIAIKFTPPAVTKGRERHRPAYRDDQCRGRKAGRRPDCAQRRRKVARRSGIGLNSSSCVGGTIKPGFPLSKWTRNLENPTKLLDRRGFERDRGGAEVERRWVRHKTSLSARRLPGVRAGLNQDSKWKPRLIGFQSRVEDRTQ